jgi:hypothetical protein
VEGYDSEKKKCLSNFKKLKTSRAICFEPLTVLIKINKKPEKKRIQFSINAENNSSSLDFERWNHCSQTQLHS